MTERTTVAILHDNASMEDNVKSIVDIMLENKCTTQIYVFTSSENATFNRSHQNGTCMNIVWPAECTTAPKTRNWINQYFKTNGFKGMLHVLEDSTKLLKDPSVFIDRIEHMVDVLDYSVWFSTITDPCNYVYRRYNPRLALQLDQPQYTALDIGSTLLYTSHSNTKWIVYDFSKVQDQLLKFDEDFTVPMFWIIEFLARRKATKKPGQLFYMNQYLTVEAEKGVFEGIDAKNDFAPQTMQEEDAKFKSKNVQYAPDNNIDVVLEETYCMLNKKQC